MTSPRRIVLFGECMIELRGQVSVSYTHLDVYKRQPHTQHSRSIPLLPDRFGFRTVQRTKVMGWRSATFGIRSLLLIKRKTGIPNPPKRCGLPWLGCQDTVLSSDEVCRITARSRTPAPESHTPPATARLPSSSIRHPRRSAPKSRWPRRWPPPRRW